jgi:hypothetical protein
MSKKPIYENMEIYAPTGFFLGYIPSHRFNWYIERNLAEKINDKAIKLMFEPKNIKSLETIRTVHEPKENKCVVCGNTQEMCRYRITPYEVKKLLPEKYKAHRANDVVALCCEDVPDADYFTKEFKLELFKKYDVDITKFKLVGKEDNIYKLIKKILSKTTKLEYANECLVKYFGKIPTKEELEDFMAKCEDKIHFDGFETPEHMLVQKVIDENNVVEFLKLWKQNFVEKMEPKYLPWDFWIELE